MVKALTKTKQNAKRNQYIGFDCETYSEKNKFLCASFYESDENIHFTKNKNSIFEIIFNGYFRNKKIVASNLTFDLNCLFELSDLQEFSLLYRSSLLLHAETYVNMADETFLYPNAYKEQLTNVISELKKEKNFIKKSRLFKKLYYLRHNFYKLEFVDTMAYAATSVKNLGKIIGVDKKELPKDFLGKIPKSENEWCLMKEYNINDSKISKMFMDFFESVTLKLGGSMKITIGSCAMSLFRNKYLDRMYYAQPKEDMLKIFNAYYGGRTETFYRGYFKSDSKTKYKMYDINSLYPSVMLNEYPNPNCARHNFKNDINQILNYDGVSHVDIEADYLDIPILPIRTKNKLMFSYGKFSGWYSHVELRAALKSGKYKILKIKECYYYTENTKPYENYVTELYNLRMEYKNQNNPMSDIIKIYLNSLYGKAGEKWLGKENIVSAKYFKPSKNTVSHESYDEYFIREVKDCEPKAHTIPIWAVYVTAYARLEILKYLNKYNVLYCDTDSIITTDTVKTSNKLGDMKLELNIKRGRIIKPKFYGVVNPEKIKNNICPKCKIKMCHNNYENSYTCNCGYYISNNKSKIKGVPKHYTYIEFEKVCKLKKCEATKFVKFKEGIKRNLVINSIIPVIKELDMNDDKRYYECNDLDILTKSKTINFNNTDFEISYYTDTVRNEYID